MAGMKRQAGARPSAKRGRTTTPRGAPAGKGGAGPAGGLATALDKEFGSFERFKGAPILSGIFSNEGIRTLDRYMLDLDFMVKYKLSIRPAKTPPPGTPKRDNYLVRVYDYPPEWLSLRPEEIEHRIMLTRLKLRRMGEKDGSMIIFSFWPDVIMIKEVGDPMVLAEYLGLDNEEFQARIILANSIGTRMVRGRPPLLPRLSCIGTTASVRHAAASISSLDGQPMRGKVSS